MPAAVVRTGLPDLETLSRKELVALVLEQHAQVEQLWEVVLALQVEIDSLKRGGRRQATPFSKGTHKDNPKKPGRKPRSKAADPGSDVPISEVSEGSDNFTFRTAPPQEAITEPEVYVPLLESCCPSCGGGLGPAREEMAYITDLPKVIVPEVRAYRVQVCQCSECGKSVRGKHEDLAQDQWGATAHRIGSRIMAAAHLLHMVAGVTVRKVPGVLKYLTGIPLTQGAITQDMLRRCRVAAVYPDGELSPPGKVFEAYQQLRTDIRDESYIHTDDTGWKIKGSTAYLMTFESKNITLFQIRPRHRNEEVREVIPSDYTGTMITDRGTSYDAKELDNVKQSKCASHILRSIDKVMEKQTQGTDQGIDQGTDQGIDQGRQASEPGFLTGLKTMMQEAVVLWWQRRRGESSDHEEKAQAIQEYEGRVRAIQEKATQLLRHRQLADKDEQTLLNQLGWHHDRGNLLRFLDEPEVEPTNNRAERALRPAVIARKVSQCSKTPGGADAYAAFASVICTLNKRTRQPLIDALCEVFNTGRIQCASP